MSEYQILYDKDLLIQLKNGSHSAYTEIYNRYFYLMYIFAYKKIGDEELSKDFVQELFITLWSKRESLSETGKLSSYLYISIRSRMLDYFAHQKVKNKYLDFLKTYESTADEKTDHIVREKELANYIEKQIQSLPDKMRQVFELSRKEHLSNKEIAQKLKISESNVSSQISNTLKIFRTKFGDIISIIL
ncbi:RNA polymerase sigma factor [Pedobacter jeongneungensis]|uniref:RNA polymerase sigma factor n=1 Tax=Pedobacter jeongneungensis TaxID=947309 RepID=UPI0004693BD1|nr:RNA polymerase sigma-70 factor [Pedobacter jeongneungensis]